MTAYTTIPMPPAGSPEWQKMRQVGIGGSEIAAIMGLSPWSSPLDVFMRKTGRVPEKESTRAMRAGTYMEDFILSEYETETGKIGGKPDHMFVSKSAPLVANADWISADFDHICEAKRSEDSRQWGEEADEVPVQYFLQVQHYMLVTGIRTADIAVLLPRNELRIFPIQADEAIQGKIHEAASSFWRNHIVPDVAPLIVEGQAGALESVKQLYSRVEPGLSKVLPDALVITCQKLEDAKARIKEAEADRDSLQAIILSQMGDAEAASIANMFQLKRTTIKKKPYLCTPNPYVTLSIKEIK